MNTENKYLLTGTRKVMIEVDSNDLDSAITEFLKSKNYSEMNFDKYGYECVAENEWGNYQSHDFTVEPEMPDAFEMKNISGLGTGEILNWMCAENLVEAGEYLVDVSW